MVDGIRSGVRKLMTDQYAKILDAWMPPDGAGSPIGCIATSFSFNAGLFEEECLSRFLGLDADPKEDGSVYLIEREEKLSEVTCAAALVDSRHARGYRSLRWDLLPARIPGGLQHAKVSLLVWQNCVHLIVASSNLSDDGYRRNQEVFGLLEYFNGGSAPLVTLNESLDFLDWLAGFAAPGVEKGAAVGRWHTLVAQVRDFTADWGCKYNQQESPRELRRMWTGA